MSAYSLTLRVCMALALLALAHYAVFRLHTYHARVWHKPPPSALFFCLECTPMDPGTVGRLFGSGLPRQQCRHCASTPSFADSASLALASEMDPCAADADWLGCAAFHSLLCAPTLSLHPIHAASLVFLSLAWWLFLRYLCDLHTTFESDREWSRSMAAPPAAARTEPDYTDSGGDGLRQRRTPS